MSSCRERTTVSTFPRRLRSAAWTCARQDSGVARPPTPEKTNSDRKPRNHPENLRNSQWLSAAYRHTSEAARLTIPGSPRSGSPLTPSVYARSRRGDAAYRPPPGGVAAVSVTQQVVTEVRAEKAAPARHNRGDHAAELLHRIATAFRALAIIARAFTRTWLPAGWRASLFPHPKKLLRKSQ